jgi:hypothetical protein
MRKGLVVTAAILFVCVAAGNLGAYTYTYSNRTGYLIRVTVRLYDDGSQKREQMEPNVSFTVSSKSLLKSWTADAYLDNDWHQVLDMTCDLLPGNQTFSIYVDEKKDSSGTITRAWNALNK